MRKFLHTRISNLFLNFDSRRKNKIESDGARSSNSGTRNSTTLNLVVENLIRMKVMVSIPKNTVTGEF